MRAALTIAALAAGALARPYKRELRTDVNMVYVTDVVTVTAGHLPTSVPQAIASATHEAVHHLKVSEAAVESPVESSVVPVVTSAAPTPSAFTDVIEQAASSVAPSFSVPAVSVSTLDVPSSAPTDYQGIVLLAHNLHRKNHSAVDLQWDEGLAASAATIAASCVYAHNTEVDGGGYGQNIAAGVAAGNVSSVITDMFYNGEEPYYADLYGQADPSMTYFENWGHFSQIVWAGTTHVACATQYCPGGLANTGGGVSPYFTVCNYGPPGNYAGEYAANIHAPIGMPTANWNTGL